MQHINNFLLRDKLGDKWTMAVSEDGLKSKGFMTVIAARDTRAAGNVPHVCKMQVRPEARRCTIHDRHRPNYGFCCTTNS